MYHFANAWDMNAIQTLFLLIIVVADYYSGGSCCGHTICKETLV